MQSELIQALTQLSAWSQSTTATVSPEIEKLSAANQPVKDLIHHPVNDLVNEPAVENASTIPPQPAAILANLEDILLQMKAEGAASIRSTPKLLSQIRDGRDGITAADLPARELNDHFAQKPASAGDLAWGKFLMAVSPLLPRQLSKKAANIFQSRANPLTHFETEG